MSFRSDCLIMLKFAISLWIFYPFVLLIIDRGVLRSLTITVDLSISFWRSLFLLHMFEGRTYQDGAFLDLSNSNLTTRPPTHIPQGQQM